MIIPHLIAIIITSSTMHNIDPLLITSIIQVESNFNPNAVGSSGEVGLMQIHPKFHKEASFEVVKNIEEGVKILASYKEACYPKYLDAWFICYNVGPNKPIKYPYKFTYYKKVMDVYAKVSPNRRYITRN